ncbi:MAG: hypothetical protein QOI84_1500 [Solirubrobacterales bacterium]|nr:hypothetical protein [Solirubrobacterales bacterium]
MIRQAHTYLVSAMSGATLIAIAIAAFVLLVSAQVFRDWPVAALGGGDSASVSKAEPVGPAPAATAGPGASAATRAGGGGNGKSGGGGSTPTAAAEEPEGGGTNGGEAAGGGGPGGSGTGSPASPAPSTADTSAGGGGGSGSPTTSTSGKVTETVNGTVTHVDETVTGGALNEAGVTPVTEGVVNGVAGPESPVGKVVDETAGAVGGVLPGTR